MDESTSALTSETKTEENMPVVTPVVEKIWHINSSVTSGVNLMDPYVQQMLSDGLVSSDLEHFTKTYKSINQIKNDKVHCTCCNKHLGTAVNPQNPRFNHPLLKVLVCEHCYLFYCSGDFEKDEDGSELYCRWCGEGGQVFCCNKCPFVFCKRCITRNLGRGMAAIIGNSDDWLCFYCNPCQISKQRVICWIMNKFCEEMKQTVEKSDNADQDLSVDYSICCKKRPLSKTNSTIKEPAAKKQKFCAANIPEMFNWKTATEPEDEVICTPDIIPFDDDSPPSSPQPVMPVLTSLLDTSSSNSPPSYGLLTPIVPPDAPKREVKTQKRTRGRTKDLTGIHTGPNVQLTITKASLINDEEKSLTVPATNTISKSSPKVIGSTSNRPVALGIVSKVFKSEPAEKNPTLNDTSVASVQKNTKKPVPAVPSENSESTSTHWFSTAVSNCADISEYIAKNLSELAYQYSIEDDTLEKKEEVFNTFISHLDHALEKLNSVKSNIKVGFTAEKEFLKSNPITLNKVSNGVNDGTKSSKTTPVSNHSNKNILSSGKRRRKYRNSKSKTKNDSSSLDSLDSEFEINSDSSGKECLKRSLRYRPKNLILSDSLRPEEVLFDMDVTNESDEEYIPEYLLPSPENEEELKIEPKRTEIILDIIDLSDDDDDEITANLRENQMQNKGSDRLREMSPCSESSVELIDITTISSLDKDKLKSFNAQQKIKQAKANDKKKTETKCKEIKRTVDKCIAVDKAEIESMKKVRDTEVKGNTNKKDIIEIQEDEIKVMEESNIKDTVDASAKVTIDSHAKATLESNANVTEESKMKITLKSNDKVTIETKSEAITELNSKVPEELNSAIKTGKIILNDELQNKEIITNSDTAKKTKLNMSGTIKEKNSNVELKSKDIITDPVEKTKLNIAGTTKDISIDVELKSKEIINETDDIVNKTDEKDDRQMNDIDIQSNKEKNIISTINTKAGTKINAEDDKEKNAPMDVDININAKTEINKEISIENKKDLKINMVMDKGIDNTEIAKPEKTILPKNMEIRVEDAAKKTDKKKKEDATVTSSKEKELQIKGLSGKELKTYLSAKVVIANDENLKGKHKESSGEEDDKYVENDYDDVDNDGALSDSEYDTTEKKESKAHSRSEPAFTEDIEDILSGSIVIRSSAPNVTQGASFGAEFSKFVGSSKIPTSDNEIESADDPDYDDNQLNIDRELAMVSEEVSKICNADNDALSLPPQNLLEFCLDDNDSEEEMKPKVETDTKVNTNCDGHPTVNEGSSLTLEKNKDSDYDSEICVLRKMAENCVSQNVDTCQNNGVQS